MFEIDIYSDYEVVEQINSCYESYDSDADDWFRHDHYVNDYTINGGKLIDMLVKGLKNVDFSDLHINTKIKDNLKIEINTFDPLSGESTEYTYFIKRVSE